ncbi:MAG: glycosyltransferase family 2 protein [Bacteroidota bacterium]
MKISVAIITFNEENNIARCLKSVRLLADEIVVVDSLSTDKTIEIAQANGARIVSQKFLGYIEQKNFAIDQCSNDWVLSLDADECLSDLLLENLIQIKKKPASADAYRMSRMTSYCGQWIKHGGWYPDKKVRLINKHQARWGGINPHDQLIVNGTTAEVKGDILHYSYHSIQGHQAQAEKFSSITADHLFSLGKKTSLIRIYVKPVVRFIRDFFFKAGFLDGKYGFVIARISAHAVFLREKKLKALHDFQS